MSPVSSVPGGDVELSVPPPVTTTCSRSAGTQVPVPVASHTPLVVVGVATGGAQSRLTLQVAPTAHWKQVGGLVPHPAVQVTPPQSTSLSLPLRTLSVQVGASQAP